ncbi:MAG: hypothetical protein JRH16_18685 [Deltaproteobacteria bacterium]|nr:hypothetical protein [Deltaproteobacteria bacterium]
MAFDPQQFEKGPLIVANQPASSSHIFWNGAAVHLIAIAGLLAGAACESRASTPPLGYTTTISELETIKKKSDAGIEPYATSVEVVLAHAASSWSYVLATHVACASADSPTWQDNQTGLRVLYAKALAYGLTGDASYALEVTNALEQIMTEVLTIEIVDPQCGLNFAWSTPELVAAAYLIEDYWGTLTCTGPTSTSYSDTTIGTGDCKQLFQNWLVKNPYYVVSYFASSSGTNWGAAATNATAFVADYLADRTGVSLVHRHPPQVNQGADQSLTPAQAFAQANQLALGRMNGYGVDYESSNSCDYMNGSAQSPAWDPVKSMISEIGIVSADARRDEFCNIQVYDGTYQNYPQINLSNNIQQCDLMLRRGDTSCFSNVDMTDLPSFGFLDPLGVLQTTHLLPGRGSIERAIKAIIDDSGTKWRHDAGLEVAFRYYYFESSDPVVPGWHSSLDRRNGCSQAACFSTLTHGFPLGERVLRGYDVADPGTAPEALLQDIDPQSGDSDRSLLYATCHTGTDPLNTVYDVGFTSGLAYRFHALYGLEVDAGAVPPNDVFLYRMAAAPCATGTRLGPAVGYTNLESLAKCPDGAFYSVDYDYTAQQGQLIRIDPETGIGAPVDPAVHLAADVRVVGLGCSEASELLYAVTAGEGSNVPELYTIEVTSGVASLVGSTGTPGGELQSLEHVRFDRTTSRLFAGGTELYEIDGQTGLATPIGGAYETLWGLAMNATDKPLFVPALRLPALLILASFLAGCGITTARRRKSRATGTPRRSGSPR